MLLGASALLLGTVRVVAAAGAAVFERADPDVPHLDRAVVALNHDGAGLVHCDGLAEVAAGGLGQIDVLVDNDAEGHGWFVDRSPWGDDEFVRDLSGALRGRDGDAGQRIDLLTVLAHELGHLLGADDADDHNLMDAHLPPGLRRLPSYENVDLVFGSADDDGELS